MRRCERARTLFVGSMLMLAALTVPAAQADAAPNHPKDNGIRCAYFDQKSGSWEFYLQGEMIGVVDGNGNLQTLICGSDGNWVRQGAGSATGLQGGGGPVLKP